jgi:hypothetical protein
MCNLIRKSLALEIVNFVNTFNTNNNSRISSFTTSAFIQSRNKIKPEVFKHLSSTIVSEFYTDNDLSVKLWHGFRLLAVDGSRLTLPKTRELEAIYGVHKNQSNTVVVQARVSVLYDVLNNFVIDSELAPLHIGEAPLAKNHLAYSQKNDLIIYDRGYPSFDLVYQHTNLNRAFLFRVKESFSTVVKAFVASGKKSQIVAIKPGRRQALRSKTYDYESTIKVRLISVKLNDNTNEILMTSLLDSKKYSTKKFKELYFKRWGVETFYDELKNKLKVEHFSGYSNNTIQQDFNVAIFISNIQSLIVSDLEEEIQTETKNRKLKYKVNSNLSYGFLKDRIIFLLEEGNEMEKELKLLFKQHLVPIRPHRNYEREVGKYNTRLKPVITKNQKDTI